MKKTKTSHKIIFVLNSVFASLLIFLYATTYISPLDFKIVGVLNLFTIPFILINILFLLFWTIKLNKRLFLSLIVLLLGWFHIQKVYRFSSNVEYTAEGLSILSYNVMQFYSLQDKRKNTYEDIKAFVKQESPDIVCMQEFAISMEDNFRDYKYKVKNDTVDHLKTVILSKYPIIDSKPLDFNSHNSGIYADIVIKNDTVRVFSIHFESLNIQRDIDIYLERPKLKFAQFKRVFPRQMNQFNIVKPYIENSPYPVILCADTNNTPLSYLYNSLSSLGLKDTFKEMGRGYGRTYIFKGFPIRLDIIMASEELKPLLFKNYDVDYSDHYPILSKVKL